MWLPPALALLIQGWLGGRPFAGSSPLWALLAAFALALAAQPLPRRGRQGLLAALLAALSLAAVAEVALAPRVWTSLGEAGLDAALANLSASTVTRSAQRSWRLSGDPEALELSFEARLVDGRLGWDWIRSGGAFELTAGDEDGEPFTHVVTPSGDDPYLMRTYDLGEPVGGSTFRVNLQLRAAEPIAARGCRGVWLQTWGEGGAGSCRAVALGPDWSDVELVWTAPEASRSTVLRVVLNDFDGLTYDVRDVRLYRREGGEWRRLAPLLQEGVSLRLSGTGSVAEPQGGLGLEPTAAWRRFRFTLPRTDGAADTVGATLTVGSGSASTPRLQVRRTELEALPDGRATPLFRGRTFLWFGHPNLASHTTLAAALAFVATTTSPAAAAVATALALGTIFLSGSRAAAGALLLGSPWLWTLVLLGRRLPRRRLLLAVVLALTVAAVLALAASSRFARAPGNERIAIWRLALEATGEHPWSGLGDGRFAAYWRAERPQATPVFHAHNLWLRLASERGLPGLAAALWITVGLLLLGWRFRRWRGLALVVPILAMNLVDDTLLYSGVLLPLILGLGGAEPAPSSLPRRR